jgi:hypothetical protein
LNSQNSLLAQLVMLGVVCLRDVFNLVVSLNAKLCKLFSDVFLVLKTYVKFFLLLVESKSKNVDLGLCFILVVFLCSSIVLNTIDQSLYSV